MSENYAERYYQIAYVNDDGSPGDEVAHCSSLDDARYAMNGYAEFDPEDAKKQRIFQVTYEVMEYEVME